MKKNKDLTTSSTAWAYAWGWVWSLWPMIGIRSWLGLGFFFIFKLPKKIYFITNYAGFIPFLLLYFPHLRLGEWLWQAERLNYTFKEMWDYVSTDPFGSLQALLPSIAHAITGWLVLAPLYLGLGFVSARWWLSRKKAKV